MPRQRALLERALRLVRLGQRLQRGALLEQPLRLVRLGLGLPRRALLERALLERPLTDEERRAIERDLAIVAVVEGARRDALAGAVVAALAAAAVWLASGRWLVGAAALCLVFPVAARGWRRLRLAGRRRRLLALDHAQATAQLAPLVAAAWERASPGQRAALTRITKPPG